jgi:hypothetical protein
VEKTKQKYVLPKLKERSFAIVRFDLWMSKGTQCDVFALVISFLEALDWQPKDI